MVKSLSVLAFTAFLAGSCHGFVPATPPQSLSTTTTTQLNFGIPSFLTPKQDGDDDGDTTTKATKKETKKSEYMLPKKDLSLSGIIQLITAGAGSPFLGDYQGVDKETGNFMFSLEANNLVDENGNSKQTQMPYFEQGWVDPEDEKRATEGFKWPWEKKS
jgi:hypothetical protein